MVPASGSLSSLTAAPGMHAEYLLSRHMTVHTRQTRQEGSGPGLLARAAALALAAALAPAAAVPAQAGQAQPSQVMVLDLDQAIELAVERNQQMAIAQAGVLRAEGNEQQARSGYMPQLFGSASYDRTLDSEFQGIFEGPAGPVCDPFTLRPDAPIAQRVSEIERALDCGAIGSPFGGARLEDLPFGRENIYRLNLSFSQALYTGGRLSGGREMAAVGRELAGLSLASTRAQLALEVTRAFYDAALSDRLVAIAEATFEQAEATLRQVQLSREAGRVPEFELLRARVARDNQRPVVIRARAQRTLAYLRLKQLIVAPADTEIRLATDLDAPELPVPDRFVEGVAGVDLARRVEPAERAVVRQAAAAVRFQSAGLKVTRAERMPTLSLSSSYGRVAYQGAPAWGDWRTNWTFGAVAEVPILTGGRLRAAEAVARADLAQAEAELELTRQLATVDSRAAIEELDAARAAWEASAGTVEQAARAYEIAELRYREGVSTQLELSDARLLFEQAQANRARAARDLQVARAHVALLPELPLSGAPATGVGAFDAAVPSVPSQQRPTITTMPVTATQPAGVAGIAGPRGPGGAGQQ